MAKSRYLTIRFEVFKRDNFTCQYCGKKSPEVVLEPDHVIPDSEGGEYNMENLITSCFECNRGKGKRLLSSYIEGTNPYEQAILLLEKERQLKEYNEVIKTVRKRVEDNLNEISKYWNRNFPNYPQCPKNIIRRALDFIPMEKVLEGIDICKDGIRSKEGKDWGETIRSYFYGIMKNITNNLGKGDKNGMD